jgi:hypothetical protein
MAGQNTHANVKAFESRRLNEFKDRCKADVEEVIRNWRQLRNYEPS